MSYAEHGPRIFLTGRFNSNPLTKYGESVGPRKRSEGRLKLFDSCTDLRAWSPNALDNSRYFREIVENPHPRGKIVPYDVMIESLIVLGNQTQAELVSVRQQLEKYKSLRLTPDQEKQLRDIEEGSTSDDLVSAKDSVSLQQSKSTEDETAIPKRPETPIQSASSSNANFREIEVDERSRSDDESSENHSEDGRSSETDADVPKKRRRDNRSASRHRNFDNKNHHETIIEKDSEIIALKNELGAKDAELEEFREHSRRLELAFNEKDVLMENLREHLRSTQQQLIDMSEEYQKKSQTSKCLVDHLKSTLAEKSQECSAQSRAIEELQKRIEETEILREERDCLKRKLDEMKAVIHERSQFIREQEMNLADQAGEIQRLLIHIKRTSAKQNKMNGTLDDLRAEIAAKNSQLSQLEEHFAPIRRRVSDTLSFSEMSTLEIRKFERILQEDLQELRKELMSRLPDPQNGHFRQEEMRSRAKNAIEWNNTMVRRDNCEREKEFMECTIEKLNMQVSATDAAIGEQDELPEQLFISNLQTSFEKIQQLIVELEPYAEERASLTETINYLKGILEERAIVESQDVIRQKQYLDEVFNKHRKQCDQYGQHIAGLKNTLAELQNERAKIVDKVRRETARRAKDDYMDKKIEKELSIRVERYIKTIEKLSAGLQGAGDYHDREMAKKEDELEATKAEIAKLKEQFDSHVSRGQGDQAKYEISNETRRLQDEVKFLESELAKTRDALQQSKDELKSREFALKGSNQMMKVNEHLKAKCKKQEQEADDARKIINGLKKEIEGLNKTVHMTDELQMEVDKMEQRLDSLQGKNDKLNEEVLKANELCAEYKNKIDTLTDREMRATEALERAKYELQTLVLKGANEIETLKLENETANAKLEETKAQIAKLTDQIQHLRQNSKNLEIVEELMSELSKVDKEIGRLRDELATRKCQFENHKRSNDKLENDLQYKLAENERLKSDIGELNKNIQSLPAAMIMPQATTKHLLNTLPHKICNRFVVLRSQLDISESESQLFQSEMEEWRTKSQEDALLIENLQQEIKLYKNKAAKQDAIIIALQETNADLKTKLGKIETSVTESLSTNSTSEISARLENEIRRKEEEIENLNQYLETMKIEQLSWKKEKTDLLDLLKMEKDLHQSRLEELQHKYNSQIRQISAGHNASVKRLEAQFTENYGKPFNAETWLKSLSPKEMAELHKRIRISTPSETISEATRIRASNDRQNQQLQQEEIHSDMLHLCKGHHNESEFGSSYVYAERRDLDPVRLGPAETPFTDMLEKKRLHFIDYCATQHKHDANH